MEQNKGQSGAAVRGEAVAHSGCARCGERTVDACNAIACGFLEGGNGEPLDFSGWKIGNACNGRIAVSHEGIGGYSAQREGDTMASGFLYELACSVRYASGFAQRLDAPAPPYQGPVEFKNLHRSLCARFGYTHDEKYWWRDLVSLEEFIAAKVSARAADAPSEPREMYECIGKGGEYELLGEAYGAGPAKGTAITVYRDTTSLGLFYRSVADFGKRMRRIGTMTGAPIGKSRAADALDSQPSGKSVAQWLRNHYQDYPNIASLCDALEGGALDSQPTDRPIPWEQRIPAHVRQIGTACSEIDYVKAELAEWRASSQPTDGGVRNG